MKNNLLENGLKINTTNSHSTIDDSDSNEDDFIIKPKPIL